MIFFSNTLKFLGKKTEFITTYKYHVECCATVNVKIYNLDSKEVT